MTKVEIDGRTYCVETLIYTVERLTKDVKASAEYHRLVLEQIMADIEKALKEPQYLHDDEDWGCGLIMAKDIIYKYMEDKNGTDN